AASFIGETAFAIDLVGAPGSGLNRSVLTRLCLGAQTSINDWFFVRAGLNQGYTTVGFGFDLMLVRIDYAYYGIEEGRLPGQLPSWRHSIQLLLGSFWPRLTNTLPSGSTSQRFSRFFIHSVLGLRRRQLMKISFYFSTFILFAALLTGCNVFEGTQEEGTGDDPEVLLQDAEAALQRDEPKLAVAYLKRAVELEPVTTSLGAQIRIQLSTAHLRAVGVNIMTLKQLATPFTEIPESIPA